MSDVHDPSKLTRFSVQTLRCAPLGLALEHQGEQHYKAISAFGGDNALQRNRERDVIKRRLCEQNAVLLVEIKFDEPLTLPLLRQRLRRFTKIR